MTDAERALWRMLRHRLIENYRFRRQVPIGPYIADFACHEAKLIIEVDGGQHDPDLEQEQRRTAFLQSQGYHLLRFWNNEVLQNPDGVHAMVLATLARRHHPHPTLPHQGGGL